MTDCPKDWNICVWWQNDRCQRPKWLPCQLGVPEKKEEAGKE